MFASELPDGEIYNAPKRNFGPRVGCRVDKHQRGSIPGHQPVDSGGIRNLLRHFAAHEFRELSQNPIGPTAGYTITPSAPIPFDEGRANISVPVLPSRHSIS